MKRLKRLGWALLAIIGVLALGVGIFIYAHRPDYDGERQLEKLSDTVSVYFDTYGIPHIYAQNELDAFRSLGYVHAQDRLWQMELLRRIGKGGLSEVFGKDLLRTDRFFLALGIDDASMQTVSHVDGNDPAIQLSQAYLDGINQFIATGPTPVEFLLTGLEKQAFELKDIYNILGYMAFSFAQAHKTDPLLTDIKNRWGVDYLQDLEIDVDPKTTWIQNHDPKASDSLQNGVAQVMKSLQDLSIPLFEGSNSWVIAPEKTKNGKVIFANDPHIGFSQPSVWYEAHVITPTYEKYGYHLAGVPFPILGHDRELAYGMTMFENDDVDFYYEEPHPTDSTKYRAGDGWASYKTVTKTIKVKDAPEVDFVYRKTDRGPILTGIADQITEDRPISMWWIYTQRENKIVDALYGMSHARDMNAFQGELRKIHAPGLNIMYGDAEGNVAWWATAGLYRIPDSVHTKFVQERGSGISPDKEYLDFSENPRAINPPWHYVYSANNQPDSIAGMLYPGYYLPENRARRIVELLEPKNDWDLEGVGQMITDATSATNPAVIKDWLKILDLRRLSQKELGVLDGLNDWKGDYPLESVDATIFARWLYFFLEHTFKDELGEDAFEQFLTTHLHKRVIAPISKKPNSVWWDDVATKDTVESQQQIVQKALGSALASLEKDLGTDSSGWTWGRVHRLEHQHPMGQVEFLRPFFNVGPFPVSGTREVINNMFFGYDGDGLYDVGSGPSTRRIIDFSDVENSMGILPTGQSGNLFSPHYDDQAEMFVNGAFRKMMMNKEEIQSTSRNVLDLVPGND